MLLADVSFYNVVIWAHLTAVLLAFGPTYGYAIFQGTAEQSAPRSIPSTMAAMTRIDRILVTPASLVVLGSGIYLVLDGPYGFDEVFVTVGMAVILILLGMVHGYLLPTERKLAELAERDIAAAGPTGDVELSAEYQALSKQVAKVGTFAGLAVILTMYFMAAKPFL